MILSYSKYLKFKNGHKMDDNSYYALENKSVALNRREKAKLARERVYRHRAFSKRNRKFKKKIHNLNVGDIVWFVPDPSTSDSRENTRMFSIVTKKRYDEITIYIAEREAYFDINCESSGNVLTEKEFSNPDEVSNSLEKDWNNIG